MALLFKTSALFIAPAALCGGAHSSIHSSTLYPPVPPTVCISYQFLLILQSFKEERKRFWGKRHIHVPGHSFAGESFLAGNAISLALQSPRSAAAPCSLLLPTADCSSASSVHLQSSAHHYGNSLPPACPSANPPDW